MSSLIKYIVIFALSNKKKLRFFCVVFVAKQCEATLSLVIWETRAPSMEDFHVFLPA
jgi:hypothetical protein